MSREAGCANDPLTVGIAGLGAIGLEVARALDRGIPGLRLGAVAVRDPETARPQLATFATAPEFVDIATLACPIRDPRELTTPSVVKVAAGFAPGQRIARALYFSRVPVPYGAGDHYHHIGLYAYRRAALERFVALPPGLLERREALEQLRALEAGMRIDVALVDTVPLGVDTPADLERARALLGASPAISAAP